MASFHLTIVTPEKIFFDGEVVSLTAPGGAGYLGVLAHHAPLLTTLVPGRLTFRSDEAGERQVDIGPGFLDVSQNRATLLTESVKVPTQGGR
jgi:F-type H+-transporting ATPase subunit epsilon